MFQRTVTIAAAWLLVLAAPSAIASDATTGAEQIVRVQPTIVPILQPSTAKSGATPSAKPAPAPRVPGPVLSTHLHHNADGTMVIECQHDHTAQQHAANIAEEAR